MAPNDVPYLARLSPELHRDLKLAAQAEGRSMASIVQDSLHNYVANRTGGKTVHSVSSSLVDSYARPPLARSAVSMRSAGADYEDIIAALGGSQESDTPHE